MPTIRRATYSDAVYVAPRLREADKQECMATLGLPPELAIPPSVDGTRGVWAMCHDDDTPFGLFGIDPVDQNPELGIVWMVSTDDLFKYKRDLVKLSHAMIDRLHDDYPLLGNHVDERNTKHIRYLRWLGFSMLKRHPKFGVEKRPFIEFARLRNRPCV